MFEKSKWIWNSEKPSIDEYCEFYGKAVCESNNKTFIRISADSDYALYVNGNFVCSGQYPDFPHYKIYDEVDISDYIKDGANDIAILVWYTGISTMTYYVGKGGLLFEILNGEKTVLKSDKDIKSRISKRFVSYKKRIITEQLGLGFEIDMRNETKWMLGEDNSDFTDSMIIDNVAENLYKRENKKTKIAARPKFNIVDYGTFCYENEVGTNGFKMQHAQLKTQNTHTISPNNEGKYEFNTECGNGTYIIVDLGSEISGFLDFEIETEAECFAEIGWGEHLIDGRARTQIDSRDFSVCATLKKGVNELLNPLRTFGGRYLQLFIHTHNFKLKYFGLRPVVYPFSINEVKIENKLRQRIYDVSVNTLIQCANAHYMDCPWREQALYILDSRNQMLCGYYAFDGYEYQRSNLMLIANGIRDDGTLPMCFPSSSKLTIPFFNLFYIICAYEYYKHSGDLETLRYCFNSITATIEFFIKRIDTSSNLISVIKEKGFWNFYEWKPYLNYEWKSPSTEGIDRDVDACLNSALSLSIGVYEEICQLLGEKSLYELVSLKKKLNKAIYDNFYDKENNLFSIFKTDNKLIYSQLVNSLCVLCGAADGIDSSGIEKLLSNTQIANLEVIPTTLSMCAFKYEALLKLNKEKYADYILKDIDTKYEKMLDADATTFWETELGAADFANSGSLCHGWSAIPIYFYHILGLCENPS